MSHVVRILIGSFMIAAVAWIFKQLMNGQKELSPETVLERIRTSGM